MLVDQFVVFVVPWGDGERLHALPVQQQLDLVLFVQTFDFFVSIASQSNLDLVLGVLRKRVRDQRTTSRSQRQTFDVLFLSQIGSPGGGVAPRFVCATPVAGGGCVFRAA